MNCYHLVIVKYLLKQALACCFGQIDPDDGCLHLFRDVCIDTQRLCHAQFADSGSEPTGSGKKFNDQQLRKGLALDATGQL